MCIGVGVERPIHAFLANSILVVVFATLFGNLDVQIVDDYGRNSSNFVGVCGEHTLVGLHHVAHNVKHH
jgi:hypothetical protein